MTEPRRLFDCLAYHLERTPLDVMLSGKEGGQWRSISTKEAARVVDDLSAGLLAMGIGPNDMTVEGRDKVAILSKNRPEWILLDLAVQQIGALLTPIYPTINVNELEFVLNDAQVKMVFVNDEDSFHKIVSIRNRVPSIKEIFTFEHVVNARHWKEVTALSSPELIARIKPISDGIKYASVKHGISPAG